VVSISAELAALEDAKAAAQEQLGRLANVGGGGVDEATDRFIDAVIAGRIETLQRDLVVFGRIDDDTPWRIGLFGIDRGGTQFVVDWRARFAQSFYQATLEDPQGLTRRVSYVGCIDDLLIEDFVDGGISGASPLMAELSKRRGTEMRAAVATLQAEQDRLVRLDPEATLVLRGGPGTGKTVVALHRAAWLVFNDRRITSDQFLVIGPSDRFLRFVSTVLPTLGEARITQTTFDRHLGETSAIGADPRWLDIIDALERSLVQPAAMRISGRPISQEDVAELCDRVMGLSIPWRERRAIVARRIATKLELPVSAVTKVLTPVIPQMGTVAAWNKLRSVNTLRGLGVDEEFIAAWRAVDEDGPLLDEVRSRFEGVRTKYAHVVVDEAQDLTLFQLRAVQRRSAGLTLVGDDAQRSRPGSLGLRKIAELAEAPLEEMTTAYRMSAEIADWLNAHASEHHLDAVTLVGIRPNGIAVTETEDAEATAAVLREQWDNVALIDHTDVWSHKGVEYDAVVIKRDQLDPAEIYLAASRAAHQLVLG
jgi:DNA helicase IV